MAMESIKDAKRVAELVASDWILFVAVNGRTSLLPCYRNNKKPIKVECPLNEVFENMNSFGNYAQDCTEYTENNKVGWRDMGFKAKGRYIKYAM